MTIFCTYFIKIYISIIKVKQMLQDQELLLQDLPSLQNYHSQPTTTSDQLLNYNNPNYHQQIITTYHFQFQQGQLEVNTKKDDFYINWSDQNNYRYFTCQEGDDSGIQQKQNGITYHKNSVIKDKQSLTKENITSKSILLDKSLYYEGLTCKLQQAMKKIKENIQKIDIIYQKNDFKNINNLETQQFNLRLSKNYRNSNNYKTTNPSQMNKLEKINKNRVNKMIESTKISSNNTSFQFMPKMMKPNSRSQSLDNNGYKQNIFASKIVTQNWKYRNNHMKTYTEDSQEVKNQFFMGKKDKIQKYMAKQIIAEENYEKKKKNLEWAVEIALWQQKKNRKIQQKLQNQQTKLKCFTFTPQINLKSRMIMKKKGTITPIYNRNDKDNKQKRFDKPQSQRYPKPKN